MIYTILFIILIILIIALYFAHRLYREEKKGRLEAEEHNEFLRNNMRILQDNVKAVREIKKKKTGIDKKIKEAVSDEDVLKVIGDIISLNNSRL